MNNNEFKKGIAVGVAVTLVVTGTGFAGYQKIMFPKGSALSDTKTVQKLNYLESLINEEYLEEKEEDSLREGLYAGIMSGLNDPYSTYYTAEQYKELNTSNEVPMWGSVQFCRMTKTEERRSCSCMKVAPENRQG
nr:hypothetical protein [Ruminococcus sp. AF46-10NS]